MVKPKLAAKQAMVKKTKESHAIMSSMENHLKIITKSEAIISTINRYKKIRHANRNVGKNHSPNNTTEKKAKSAEDAANCNIVL